MGRRRGSPPPSPPLRKMSVSAVRWMIGSNFGFRLNVFSCDEADEVRMKDPFLLILVGVDSCPLIDQLVHCFCSKTPCFETPSFSSSSSSSSSLLFPFVPRHFPWDPETFAQERRHVPRGAPSPGCLPTFSRFLIVNKTSLSPPPPLGPCAQRRCYPTGRCACDFQSFLDCQ
jgi:hypothetical protein